MAPKRGMLPRVRFGHGTRSTVRQLPKRQTVYRLATREDDRLHLRVLLTLALVLAIMVAFMRARGWL